MTQKYDLVMWTKNSSKNLKVVLDRIESVIPERAINKKFIIDDVSIDNTVEIAKDKGWEVYKNPDWGVAPALKFALQKTESKYLMSFEHDILIAPEWYDRIPKHLNEKTIVAQGIRIYTTKLTKSMDKFILHKLERSNSFWKHVSLDNTVYDVEAVNDVGVSLKCHMCADLNLLAKVRKRGFRWLVDKTVVSRHIDSGALDSIKHRARNDSLCSCHSSNLVYYKHMLVATLRALDMVAYTKNVELFPYYVTLRFYDLAFRLSNSHRKNTKLLEKNSGIKVQSI
jgi:glycosyltransferase involved in cell wall biosynthesis